MPTVHLLRAGFGVTILLVAVVGGISLWGDVRGIEETALQEAGGVSKILTYLVLRHPGDNPLVSHQAAIQADVVSSLAWWTSPRRPICRDGL
jgi:hypothetical protein